MLWEKLLNTQVALEMMNLLFEPFSTLSTLADENSKYFPFRREELYYDVTGVLFTLFT
jgi:hypothetical protein